MDKASDFGSEDWGFESLRGRILIFFFNPSSPLINKEKSICCSRLKERKMLSMHFFHFIIKLISLI